MARYQNIFRLGPLFLLAVAAPVSVSAGGIATGLVLISAVIWGIVDKDQLQLPPRSVVLALAGLVGVYFLATLLSNPYPHNWYKFFEELWIKLLLVAVPILVGRRETAIRLVQVALFAGFLVGIYAIWQHFSEFDPIRQKSLIRPQWGHAAVTGFFNHHLSYAGQVLVYFLMTISWLLAGKPGRREGWLLPAGIILAGAIFWTFARSALLGVGAGALLLILLTHGWRRWAGLGMLTAMAGAALLVPATRAHLGMLFEMKRHVTRLNLWESSWHGIQARPFLGFGPGNFESLLAGYKVDGYYESLAHSHQDLLMHGVNAGIPGILAALLLLGTTCLVFWKGWRQDIPDRWVFLGALGIQVGITVAGLFQVYQTDDEVEILLYFILGCVLAVFNSRCRVPDSLKSQI